MNGQGHGVDANGHGSGRRIVPRRLPEVRVESAGRFGVGQHVEPLPPVPEVILIKALKPCDGVLAAVAADVHNDLVGIGIRLYQVVQPGCARTAGARLTNDVPVGELATFPWIFASLDAPVPRIGATFLNARQLDEGAFCHHCADGFAVDRRIERLRCGLLCLHLGHRFLAGRLARRLAGSFPGLGEAGVGVEALHDLPPDIASFYTGDVPPAHLLEGGVIAPGNAG
mmetsp:Transcript_70777/g.112153  ORF Transcript_70777/g.112153 Transcript_70777/m.112153 type:complete len:227 (-) Transcript_70777:187-867(-)